MQGSRNASDYLVSEYLLIHLVKQRGVTWIICVHLLARIVIHVNLISRIVLSGYTERIAWCKLNNAWKVEMLREHMKGVHPGTNVWKIYVQEI